MRILDVKNDKAIKKANIFLTEIEVKELLSDLKGMLENKGKAHHTHINDLMYEHEITLALYEEDNIEIFDERTKKLIVLDE